MSLAPNHKHVLKLIAFLILVIFVVVTLVVLAVRELGFAGGSSAGAATRMEMILDGSQATTGLNGNDKKACPHCQSSSDIAQATPGTGTTLAGTVPWSALWLAVASAFGMGLLAAISPCALATNAVAISFLGKTEAGSHGVFWRGVGYSVGRVMAYVGLGMVIVSGLLSVSIGSRFLIKYINSLLGAILIIVSLYLFKLLNFNWSIALSAEGWLSRAEKGGVGPALLLGIVLALAFCPMSAALFFGGLLPLAIKSQSSVLLPAAFGLGTGLPVVLFALLVALTSQALSQWFKRLQHLATWLRLGTALIFLSVGCYYSISYVLCA